MQFNQRCVWMLGEILIQNGWVSWDQLAIALSAQRQNSRMLGEILVGSNIITRRTLYRALASQYGMAFIELTHFVPQEHAIRMIPKHVAYEYRIMPLIHREETLLIAVSSPNAVWPDREIVWKSKIKDIRTVLCCPEDISLSLEHYYGAEDAAA